MSTIHRANDERFDRIVCVKLLRVEIEGVSTLPDDPKANAIYQNFVREALALSKLQHPNTLRIYDFGYIAGGKRPFQVSEFLDGGDLRQLVRERGALLPGEVLAILERITGATAEAHQFKILHRDIKPPNILFSRVGDVLMPKLADFGIARTLLGRMSRPEDPAASDEGFTVGMFSPRWAAPEQLAGEPEGPYTDVYGLALLTVYMLSAKNLFEGAHLHEAIEERERVQGLLMRRMAPLGVPDAVTEALTQALRQDPEARTATAPELFDNLRAALDKVPMSLPPRLRPSGGMPPGRPASVTPSSSSGVRRPAPPPPPRPRGVRVQEAYEKLDLSTPGADGDEVRLRVSIVPDRDKTFRIQIKGLNCFIARVGPSGSSRPTPAINATEDGTVELVSTQRRVLARLSFAFGRSEGADQVFTTANGDLVIPSLYDSSAVALDFGGEREIIVMCQRA
jgi:serine/threonine-protein kinase